MARTITIIKHFCTIHMIDFESTINPESKFEEALRQLLIKKLINCGNEDYHSLSKVFRLGHKLIRFWYHSPTVYDQKTFELETIKHKLAIYDQKHQSFCKALKKEFKNELVKQKNHCSNKMAELRLMKRNIENNKPRLGTPNFPEGASVPKNTRFED